jgi:hypothetical protein
MPGQFSTASIATVLKPQLIVRSLAVVVFAGAAVSVAGAAAQATTGPCGTNGVLQLEGSYDQCRYTTPGTDVFTPPAGVSEVSAGALGAQGGTNSHNVSLGGAAENVSGLLPVNGPLFIDVGAAGAAGTSMAGGAGGQNGTTVGTGGNGGFLQSSVTGGGGGGASSDIRAESAPSVRLLVAAGGGGAGDNGGTGDGDGGNGGAGGDESSGHVGANGLATDTREDIDGQVLSTPPGGGGQPATSTDPGAGGYAGPLGQAMGGDPNSDDATLGLAGLQGNGLTGDNLAGDGGAGGDGVATANAVGAGGGSGGGGGGGYAGGGGGGSAGSIANTAGGVGGAGGGGGGGTSYGPLYGAFSAAPSSNTPLSPSGGSEVILFAATTPSLSASASPATGAVGTATTDAVQLSGGGSSPSGSMTFGLYAAADTTCANPLIGSVSTTTVSGAKTYTSASFAPSTAGTYFWNYQYSGDVTYLGQSGSCGSTAEKVVLTAAGGGGGGGGGGLKPPAPPSNVFTLGKPVKHPSGGTATVTVTLPDAGKLVLTGTHVHKRMVSVKEKEKVKVTVAATGTPLSKLKKHHVVKLHTVFTFTPTGGKANKHKLAVTLTDPKKKH